MMTVIIIAFAVLAIGAAWLDERWDARDKARAEMAKLARARLHDDS